MSFVRPTNDSWSPSGLPVPDLDGHVEPPGDEVGAAGQPVGLRVVIGRDPDMLVDLRGLLGLEVLGAVLEPEQVPRRGLAGRGGRGTAEAQLRPAHRDGAEADPGQVADRVHGHLRVVGTGLDAEIAVRPLRVERVHREVRQRAERRGLPVGQAEAVLAVVGAEQRRPEAEGDRQPVRREPDRLAGVVGRGVGGALDRTDRARGLAGGHPLGRVRPLLEQGDEPVAVVGGDVEHREVQPVLGRGDDAGLVLPPERVRRGAGRRLAG